jgi:polyisoprenoid-binding protein YceI
MKTTSKPVIDSPHVEERLLVANDVPARRRSRKWWYVGAAVLLVVTLAAVGVAIWYFVFRDDSPPAVSIDRASASLESTQSDDSQAAGAVDGSWTIDPTIGTFADFTSSFAGYRVQEEFVTIGAKTAVGRTPDIEGSFTVDGDKISAADFTVDMTTLQSDNGHRDAALRDQGIESARFPTATFTLTTPIALDKVPTEAKKLSVDATGDLTVHGVTRQVSIPLEAQRTGNVIAVTGQLDIPFADFDIEPPTVAGVLSVENRGILEVQLFLTRQP